MKLYLKSFSMKALMIFMDKEKDRFYIDIKYPSLKVGSECATDMRSWYDTLNESDKQGLQERRKWWKSKDKLCNVHYRGIQGKINSELAQILDKHGCIEHLGYKEVEIHASYTQLI